MKRRAGRRDSTPLRLPPLPAPPVVWSRHPDSPYPSPAEIDVVIVNWNSGDLLGACIAGLATCTRASSIRVIVVDNASTDRSTDILPKTGLSLRIVRNADNLGFGRACNQGASLGTAPVILFLNPDTQVEPDGVATALADLLARFDTGIVGAQLGDRAGEVQRSCARRPTALGLIGQDLQLDRLGLVPAHFMRDWDHAETRAVDQVMGAFLMVRRTLFERLGGFDERFFVYYEDVDLCARAIDAGFEVRHVAEARVRHCGQGTTRQVKALRLFYILRSRILYAAKHHGSSTALALLLTAFAVQVPLRLALALHRLSAHEAGETLRAALHLARAVPALLRHLAGRPSDAGPAHR